MLSLLLYGLLAVVAVVVLFVIAVFVLPSGTEIGPAPADQAFIPALPDAALGPVDISAVRLPVAWRGYRFAEVDLLLDRIAEELRVRDEELSRLRAPVPVRQGLDLEPPANEPGPIVPVKSDDS